MKMGFYEHHPYGSQKHFHVSEEHVLRNTSEKAIAEMKQNPGVVCKENEFRHFHFGHVVAEKY